MVLAVPCTAEEFTPDWLTAALRASGALRAASVTGVVASPVGAGVGLLGSLARLELTYDRDEAGAPRTVVAKFPAKDDVTRDIARQYRVYEREYRFFERVAPLIRLSIPRALGSAIDESTGDAAILLEDLAGVAEVGDQLASPDQATVEMCVDELVKLHAPLWGRCDRPDLAWVPALTDPVWMQVPESFKGFWPVFQQNFPETLNERLRTIGDRLGTALPGIATRLCAPPVTLVHTDYRVDNMLFGRPGAAAPLIVIDWQLMSLARGAYDLAYYMSQSLDPELRSRVERDMVARYVAGLRAAGVTDYDFDAAFSDYRLATLWSMIYPISAGGGIDLANERGRQLAGTMARRSFTAVQELDADRLLED